MKYSQVKKIYNFGTVVIQRSTLPFRGEEPNFQEQLQNFDVEASKFHHLRSFDLNDLKGLTENLKKMSWDNPVSPIDAKISMGFYVLFFFWLAWKSR